MSQTNENPTRKLTRRQVLKGAALLGATAGLAACAAPHSP